MEKADVLESNVLYKQYSKKDKGTKIKSRKTIEIVAITTVIEEEESMEGTPISKTRHQSSFETIPKHHASVNNVLDLATRKNMSRESTESDL